jgi:arylsulfatase A-like enzyme
VTAVQPAPLVVVTGDHGEEFLEHGGKTHQRTIFQEVLHVPLILWSRSGLPRGLTLSQPVAIEDVAPTILAVVGIEGLEHADGRSLLPLLRGGAVDHPALTSALYFDFSNEIAFVGVRRGDTKLIHSVEDDQRQQFDLRSDPGEAHPLPITDRTLEAALDGELAEARSMLAAREGSRKKHRAALPPDVIEKLKKLGYLR